MSGTTHYLGQVVLVSSLLRVLALPLVRQLHVVEAIEWGNAQNLAPEQHKINTGPASAQKKLIQ